MGKDKTSWLNLDDDEDDDLSGGDQSGGAFTQSIDPTNSAEPTYVPSNDGSSEMKTDFDPVREKTEIYHAGMENSGFDPMTDPIVGWLVVVRGPGLGQSVNLGSGMNTVGRDPSERTALKFGDNLISGKDHLRIIYDDANRAFFVAPGSGRNISRMNGQIVANTAPMENYALLELSKQTHVRFVAFCNEAFDWSDVVDQAK
jgi:hypothetical protein